MKSFIYVIVSAAILSTSLKATNLSDLDSSIVTSYRMGATSGWQVFPYKVAGFSHSEGPHRWSVGNNSSITIPIFDGSLRVKSVMLKNMKALTSDTHQQPLTISLNDVVVNNHVFHSGSPSYTVEVPIDLTLHGNAVISFTTPNAITPKDLGLNNDPRKLAIQFDEIGISYVSNLLQTNSYHLGQSMPFVMEGFPDGEGTHRWTAGNQVSISIPVMQGHQRVRNVTFMDTKALVNENHLTQRLRVSLNGQQVKNYTYQYPNQNLHNFSIAIPSSLSGHAVLTFTMPDARSPQQLSLSQDVRQLGVSFGDMTVAYETPIFVENLFLRGYNSIAANAAVIVYGISKVDGKQYALFAHDKKKKVWTIPGGIREKTHMSILDTVAAELYEESAAFEGFNPSQVKLLLEQESTSCVFNYKSKQGVQTDIFALSIDFIDDVHQIGTDYKTRIQGKGHSFDEMDAWKLVPLTTMHNEFNSAKKSFQRDPSTNYYYYSINGLGDVSSYCFNSIRQYYRAGKLDQITNQKQKT